MKMWRSMSPRTLGSTHFLLLYVPSTQVDPSSPIMSQTPLGTIILDRIEIGGYRQLLLERLLTALLMVSWYVRETQSYEALHTSFQKTLQGQVCQSHRVLGSDPALVLFHASSMHSRPHTYRFLLTLNCFSSTVLGAGNNIHMVPVPMEFSQVGRKTGAES